MVGVDGDELLCLFCDCLLNTTKSRVSIAHVELSRRLVLCKAQLNRPFCVISALSQKSPAASCILVIIETPTHVRLHFSLGIVFSLRYMDSTRTFHIVVAINQGLSEL